ncbi:MAG TPA: zinc-binding dehydrogenase [Candidatus Acidoferrales bacterium]|nr:zinc-binding dehydrogenase [Candidatus Acidoferrales bacterium]
MHAIVVDAVGEPSVLQWKEVPDPKPGPGQVAIKVTLTSVNFADVQQRRGTGAGVAKTPFTPGLDCMGTVLALGEGVKDLRVGQRVSASPDAGSYAEIVVARDVLTVPVDDAISDEAAASSTVLVTAYNLLTLVGRLQRGESVLIHAAAGGVGSTAVQMAKQLGVGKIFATAGGEQKLKIARDLGADVAIDYVKDDFAKAIADATGGTGVDVVLDAVGGDVFVKGLPVLANFGRYCVYGQSSGSPGSLTTDLLHRSNRAVLGYSSGHYRRNRPAAIRPAIEAALKMAKDGKVKILDGGRFPLRDAAKAHQLVESRASTGRLFLTV